MRNLRYLQAFAPLFLMLALCGFTPISGQTKTNGCQSDKPIPVRADSKDEKKEDKKHGRGHKLPSKEKSSAQHKVSNAKYGHVLKSLPKATQAAYDAYTATSGSVIPPIGDQGPCGNCYEWSGSKSCSAAQMTAGIVKPGTGFMLSVQYLLDYHPELGGCNGGDEYQVAQTVQSNGCPSLTDYPGSGQSPGDKQPVMNLKTYTISSIVYVDPTQTDQGIASTQSIKNAVLAYGYVSVAVAAGGGDWDRYSSGTLTGTNAQIDHAVGITGWDDTHDNGDGTKGAWKVDNQWSEGWGIKGRAWVKYGADAIGTEAFVTLVNAPAPPNPPTPVNPPVPVTPPLPVTPTGSGFTGTIVQTKTYLNGSLVSDFTDVNTGTDSADVVLAKSLKDASVNPAVVLDVLQLLSDIRAKKPIAGDLIQLLSDFTTSANPVKP